MIKNIIFDMGQVLMHFRPVLFIERLGIAGPDKELLLREVFGGVEWVQLDHGTVSEEEAVQSVCKRVPEHLHGAVRELICHWWQGPLCPVPGMAELMKELKEAGYHLYLLSNASLQQAKYHDRIPGAEYLDGRLVSAECGLMKPQHEIYRLLLDTYKLAAEESIFIDDVPMNVEAAVCVGIHGIVFADDVARLRGELLAEGVNLGRKNTYSF